MSEKILQNPFDKESQSMKYEITEKLLEPIKAFLEDVYTKQAMMNAQQRSILEHQQRLNNLVHSFELRQKESVLGIINEAKQNILRFMKETYPDLDFRLEESMKKLESKIKSFEKELKKRDDIITKSDQVMDRIIDNKSSIYEDVYNIRDDLKEMRKFYESFQKRLGNLFGQQNED
jgi:hypothetical protein